MRLTLRCQGRILPHIQASTTHTGSFGLARNNQDIRKFDGTDGLDIAWRHDCARNQPSVEMRLKTRSLLPLELLTRQGFVEAPRLGNMAVKTQDRRVQLLAVRRVFDQWLLEALLLF